MTNQTNYNLLNNKSDITIKNKTQKIVNAAKINIIKKKKISNIKYLKDVQVHHK